MEKDALVNRIGEDAKARLSAAGFNLISFRMSQLVIGKLQVAAPKMDSPLDSLNG